MYRYETHCHTSPVSRCARATVADTVQCYKDLGYDGVFITNHFIDGNIAIDSSAPYKEKIEFYCSDYEKAFEYGGVTANEERLRQENLRLRKMIGDLTIELKKTEDDIANLL